MKKLSIAANIVFLCIIVIQSYKLLNRVSVEKMNCNNICSDYSGAAPFEYLSLDLLNNMSAEYNNVMMGIPSLKHMPIDNDPDARSIWFPLDRIERFIWEIRSKTCNYNCDSLKLGIRMYYSRYKGMASNDELDGMNTDFEGRHTLFMIPTFHYKDGDYDFDPKYWRSDSCLPKTLYAMRNGADSNALKSNGVTALTMTARNHGSLCPPLCKPHLGDDFFTEGF